MHVSGHKLHAALVDPSGNVLERFEGKIAPENLVEEAAAVVKKLVKEYNIDIDCRELGVNYIGCKGPSVTSEEKLKSFLNMLDNLKAGETYYSLIIPH